ncbi:hypothetical protein Tco_1389326 [Tanacetum coccineum]
MEAIRSKFFNGADISDRKITWAASDKVLTSNKNGGLGVSSFHALNRALLLKWVWCFISQDGSLWFLVIQAVYGSSFYLHSVNQPSIWRSILREVHLLKSKGFPRLFALETDKEATVAAKLGASSTDVSFRMAVRDGAERQQWSDLNSLSGSVSLSSSKDRWIYDLTGDGDFRVKEVRNTLDDLFLPSQPDATRRVKYIPIKINVFAWRVWLNIEKLDGNIVQKHGGSKQVGFKQLGLGVETGVHGVSNDDTAVAQRWLEDKKPEEKTNTNCLVKEQEKEYQAGWKIKTGNVLDSFNQRSTQQILSVHGFWAKDTTMSTYLVNRSRSSAIGFKTPIDMLGIFGWLASIKQRMLESVKVKCIFMGYHKGIVGNKLWRFDDVTSKVVLYRNMGFNESGEYKKTFIGSGIARDREQYLACELFGYREYSKETAFAVAAVEKIYAYESLTFNDTVAYEVISKWKVGLKDDMDARSDVYVLSNGCKKCSDDIDGYYWESAPCMIYNEKLVQTLLKRHSILSLEGSLSGDCDVEKNDVGMLDKFDHGLQADVQVFVDFDYAMGRSITSGVYDTYRGLEEGNMAKGTFGRVRI